MSVAISEALRVWSDPTQYHFRWARRARVAARMCRGEQWVCDLGCGMQFLKSFLPRTAVYLPADLKQWTEDTELCDLDAGRLPTRSLDLCGICVLLGVIGHLRDPEALIQGLSQRVEKVLIAFTTTDFTRKGRAQDRATAYALSEMYAMLDRAGFRITDQRQYVHNTMIKAQSERFDAASRELRDKRRAVFAPDRRTLADEWIRLLLQLRTAPTAFQRI
jgi:hypothetical protein